MTEIATFNENSDAMMFTLLEKYLSILRKDNEEEILELVSLTRTFYLISKLFLEKDVSGYTHYLKEIKNKLLVDWDYETLKHKSILNFNNSESICQQWDVAENDLFLEIFGGNNGK